MRGTPVDYRYENPHDVALAAYAWMLNGIDERLGPIAAEVLLSAKQTWWSREVAATILQRDQLPPADTRVPLHFGLTEEGTITTTSSNAPALPAMLQLLGGTETTSLVIPSAFVFGSREMETGQLTFEKTAIGTTVIVANPKRNEQKQQFEKVA